LSQRRDVVNCGEPYLHRLEILHRSVLARL
jgi:hypothetical protein